MTTSTFSRRNFLSTTTAALTATAASLHQRLSPLTKRAAVQMVLSKIGLQELGVAGKEMGLTSVELLQPSDFPAL